MGILSPHFHGSHRQPLDINIVSATLMLIHAGEGCAQFRGSGGQVQREGEELCVVANSLTLAKMKGQPTYPLEIAAK
jgi:hypothetical protein